MLTPPLLDLWPNEDTWVLLIYGPSGVGKTTLARAVAESAHLRDLDSKVISASGWLADRYPGHYAYAATLDPKARTAHLTGLSLRHLAAYPNDPAEWLVSQVRTCRPVIIEGIRNPMDLAAVARIRRILAVPLHNPNAPYTGWEYHGVEAMHRSLCFLQEIRRSRVHHPRRVWGKRGVSTTATDYDADDIASVFSNLYDGTPGEASPPC